MKAPGTVGYPEKFRGRPYTLNRIWKGGCRQVMETLRDLPAVTNNIDMIVGFSGEPLSGPFSLCAPWWQMLEDALYLLFYFLFIFHFPCYFFIFTIYLCIFFIFFIFLSFSPIFNFFHHFHLHHSSVSFFSSIPSIFLFIPPPHHALSLSFSFFPLSLAAPIFDGGRYGFPPVGWSISLCPTEPSLPEQTIPQSIAVTHLAIHLFSTPIHLVQVSPYRMQLHRDVNLSLYLSIAAVDRSSLSSLFDPFLNHVCPTHPDHRTP
ncbi:conserved hypothetical protein [delta proteobacterium NaphS2]|nr:conserved hypothetical protein [delta proteobacterium NaphS2]